MANEFANAFDDLFDAYCEERGETVQASFAGTLVDAIPTQIGNNEMFVHGGHGEGDVYSVMVRRSDFGSIPAQKSAVTVEGKAGKILHIDTTNLATYTVYVGDFKTQS